MPAREIHQCQCPCCQQAEPHPDQQLHAQMNLLCSRLDEQQRRWYAAVESHKVGHGGDSLLALIIGLHVDTIRRDRQFCYLQGQLERCRDHGWPVISVDAKKSELIGNFKNAGALWCWQAAEVNCHDFLTDAVGRAVPYGVYDVLAHRGFVQVGLSANTPAFAVAAVRAWWVQLGCKRYSRHGRLLILAD